MTKNPLYNAVGATLYITLVACVMTWGSKFAPKDVMPLTPIAVLSLFTLSAAVMGYIFCFEPGQLYFSGKKKEAVTLFLQTVLAFACLTALAFVLLFSGVLR